MIDRRFPLFPFQLFFLFLSIGASEDYSGWPVYRGGPEAIQYSSLDQINRENVTDLEIAWTYNSGDAGGRSMIQCNPIEHNGVLYVTSPKLAVIALNAETGQELWRYNPTSRNSISGVNRGVTYWENNDSSRILFTAGHYLIALDASSGKIIPDFGEQGRVDLRQHLDHPPEILSLSVTSPGIIYHDLIIMGSATGEGYQASPGHVRAYNVVTGELVWTFRTIPREGETGAGTWNKWENEQYGGTNVWGGFSLDQKRGWVFLATGSPTYDFYGANRVGQNLFGNCIVAVDAATGQYIWHYQVIQHDLWDYDLPCAPSLARINIKGEMRDVVAQPTKMGYLIVLDRETGQPLYPMDDIPVPPSDIPGEYAWPSQPIPATGFFTRQSVSESDLRDFSTGTGEDALTEYRKYRYWGRFTPPSLQGSLAMPSTWGGALWGGASFDPRSGTLFVNANELASINQLEPIKIYERTTDHGDRPKRDLALKALGQGLYAMNCVACHGSDLNGVPPAFPALAGIQNRMSDVEIRELITHGKGAMPAFTQFEENQLEAIIGFIKQGKPIDTMTVRVDHSLTRYVLNGFRKFLDSKGYPFTAPPWGSLNAIDLSTGKIKWRVPLGEIEELTRIGVPITGNRNFGGCISTAGNLVFIAATTDEKIRAFDSATGEVLWSARLPAAGYAVPATYMLNGRQYLVIACGGGGRGGTPSGDAYIAFALPG